MRTKVTVFRCDWPECDARLVAPEAASVDAKRFAGECGWLWTADDAE
ncbi:hypothetical protein ACFYZ8_33160 [Streptomyces sp. NPDC001668]